MRLIQSSGQAMNVTIVWGFNEISAVPGGNLLSSMIPFMSPQLLLFPLTGYRTVANE